MERVRHPRRGDRIRIYLNDVLVNDFTSTDPARDLSSGFIGIQNHGNGEAVSYRDIRVKDLAAEPEPALAVSVTAVPQCVAARSRSASVPSTRTRCPLTSCSAHRSASGR
ncbi:DUF1080 domain-containing protein [Oerskovia sp. M15]